ncbi:MAG: ABC transporter permease [Fimbriimonadaceae bacterium]|nr:ABC transporter permease [Fimbriimonadaceae bacterium]
MKKPTQLLQDYGVLVAFVVLLLISVATRGSQFLQAENLRNLVSQNAYVGLIAIGMTFVIMTGGIDLSVGSLVALCGAIAVLLLNKMAAGGMSPNMAILTAALGAIAIGGLAGLLNGLVIAYGRVAPFIVTLAGLAGFRSIALVLGDGGEIRSSVPAFQNFGFGGLPLPGIKNAAGGPVLLYWAAIIFFAVAFVAAFILNRTKFGRYLIAVGANERAAKYSAINTQTVKVAAYAILGGLVGLAAILLTARMNSVGTGSVGLYYELDAIAAVVIGGTSLRGGKGRIWGTVIGVLLLTLIANMMTAYRIDTNWQGLVRGLVILIAVMLQRGKSTD